MLVTTYFRACLNFKHKKKRDLTQVLENLFVKYTHYNLVKIKLNVSVPAHDKEALRVQKNINTVLKDAHMLQDVTALIKVTYEDGPTIKKPANF